MNSVNLFNRDGENIFIYKMIPDEGKISNFKRYEEERILEKDRVYCAKTSLFNILEENEVDESKLNTKIDGLRMGKGSYFHSFEPVGYTDYYKNLLENYYNGLYTDSRVVTILRYYGSYRNKAIKYLLMTMDKYKDGEINNIISIPESLYYMQMIEQGRFGSIYRDNIDTQLSFYTLSNEPVNQLTIYDLENLHKSLSSSEPFEKTLEQVDAMSKVYKRIKR